MRLPEKFEDRMKKMLGDEYDDFIKSMDETPIFTGIRINTSKVGAHVSRQITSVKLHTFYQV